MLDQWVYIGKLFLCKDVKNKIVGVLNIYMIDFQCDGLLMVIVVCVLWFGGMVKFFDVIEVKKVVGVVDVFQILNGIVVVVESIWLVIKVCDFFQIEWDDSVVENWLIDVMMIELKDMIIKLGVKVCEDGDVDVVFEVFVKVMEIDYDFLFFVYGVMELLDIVGEFDGEKVQFWFGLQILIIDYNVVFVIFGILFQNVSINMFWVGGLFGCCVQGDVYLVFEIFLLMKVMCDVGMEMWFVKIVWICEDDMGGGYYWLMLVYKIKVGLDNDGNVMVVKYNIVVKLIIKGIVFE